MQTVPRCGLLLQTLYVVGSVCLSVCVLGTRVGCTKMSEPIEVPLGGLTHMRTRNHVSYSSQDQTNPLDTVRGETTAIWPFAKLLQK